MCMYIMYQRDCTATFISCSYNILIFYSVVCNWLKSTDPSPASHHTDDCFAAHSKSCREVSWELNHGGAVAFAWLHWSCVKWILTTMDTYLHFRGASLRPHSHFTPLVSAWLVLRKICILSDVLWLSLAWKSVKAVCQGYLGEWKFFASAHC